ALAHFTGQQGQSQVGYVPPDARGRLQPEITGDRPPDGAEFAKLPADNQDPAWTRPPNAPAKRGLLAPRIDVLKGPAEIPDEVDYCVIGSGAAGAIIASRLGALNGGRRSISVVEQGGYYSPGQDFSDDELRMIRTLYADGGLQVTRSFDFTILQGQC